MWHFIQAGGPVMFVLIPTSIVALAFIIERGMALRWPKVVPPALLDALDQSHSPEDAPRLIQLAQAEPSALGRLVVVACQHLQWPKSENTNAVETRARQEIARLERGLVVLEIAVGISPLLGLVGTIQGLIALFGTLGSVGMNDNAVLASGIAMALNATLTGLLIAIPSLIAWSYYSKKVERLAVELETLCDDLVRRLYHRRKER